MRITLKVSKMSEWISVKDRLPDDYKWVEAKGTFEYKAICNWFYRHKDNWFFPQNEVFVNLFKGNILYWQPLPDLPKENQE